MKKALFLLLMVSMILIYSADLAQIKLCIANSDNNDSIVHAIKYFQSKNNYTDEEYGLYVKAYYYYGHITKKKKEKINIFNKGIAVADNALQQNGKNINALYYKAAIMGKYGETKGILKSLALVKPIKKICKDIIKIDPKYAGSYHILGVMYRKLPGFAGGDKEKSYEYLKKATELEPTFSLHFLELANTCLKMKGKKEEALKYYKIVLNGDFPKDRIEEKKDKQEAKNKIEKITK